MLSFGCCHTKWNQLNHNKTHSKHCHLTKQYLLLHFVCECMFIIDVIILLGCQCTWRCLPEWLNAFNVYQKYYEVPYITPILYTVHNLSMQCVYKIDHFVKAKMSIESQRHVQTHKIQNIWSKQKQTLLVTIHFWNALNLFNNTNYAVYFKNARYLCKWCVYICYYRSFCKPSKYTLNANGWCGDTFRDF